MGNASFRENILYKHLFMQANDAIVLYDDNDKIVDVNHRACELFGYSREELLSFRLEDLKPPEWKKENPYNRIEWELSRYGNDSFETADIRKDGSKVVIEVTNSVIVEDGKKYVFSIVRDKTEQKKAERELERSEAIKQSIMQSTVGINIWAIDSDYRYTFFNNAHMEGMKEVWNADIEIGRCVLDYINDPDYREDVRRNYRRLLSGEEHHTLDKLKDTKGSFHYYENTGYPIYNDGGEITGATIFTTDVTERVVAERDLKKSLALQQSIMNSPPDIIILSIDPEYRYIFFNNAHREAMLNIWGVEPRLGDNVLKLLPDPEYRRRVKGGYDKALRGELISAVDEFTDKKGNKKYYQNISSPIISGENEIVGITLFILDVTDRTLAEEKIKDSLREKEVLLKEVHHRVKNNLQIISSMLNMQIDMANSPDVRLHFREAQNRINTMALIHDQLYQSENLAKIEMEDYIQNLVSYIIDTYYDKNVSVSPRFQLCRLRLGLDQAIPLGLIINELVSNAMKYAFSEKAEGEISISMNKNDDGRYTLIIADDGGGFSEDFDPAKLDTLGIKMIEALSQQLEGEFYMESRQGVRATLTFSY